MATSDTLLHQFQSAKGDGADATLVQPSKWNQEHKVGQLMTNKSGSQRVANDVVVVDAANDGAVVLTTTQADPRQVMIVQATINADAEGLHKAQGITVVAVQDAVARGNTLRTSTTSGKAQDTGSTALVPGAFAVALTAKVGAGAGTVIAYLFGHTSPGTIPVAATQAQQEAASDLTVMVTPGRQHFHPSAAKAWVLFDTAGAVVASYNVTSVTKNGTGDWTVNFTTAMSSANYVFALSRVGSNVMRLNFFDALALTAGTIRVASMDFPSGSFNEDGISQLSVVIFGDL